MSEFKGLERSCNKDFFTLKQKNMLEQVSNDYPSLLNHFRRAYRGVSRKSAIQAKCIECCWGDKKAIRECTSEGCPLWKNRPYQRVRTQPPPHGGEQLGKLHI